VNKYKVILNESSAEFWLLYMKKQRTKKLYTKYFF